MAGILVDKGLADQVIDLAKSAGKAILEVYETDFQVELKDDRSPLTEADKRSHGIISEGLKTINPDIPILSEEGVDIPFEERKNWQEYWLVDPLDGTKEFIKRNGEFTVNIALMQDNKPVLGVVFAPVLDVLYWGGAGLEAFKIVGESVPVQISAHIYHGGTVKVVTSRSHPSRQMNYFLTQFEDYELIPMGSSLKVCIVAEAGAHFYPRLGSTMEWDTAAAHAVINAAVGRLIKVGTNEELEYNKKDLKNPFFIAQNKHSIIPRFRD